MSRQQRTDRLRETTPEITEAARLLRRRQTPAEAVLWAALRGQQIFPLRVRRQHAYGPYVLDFWIPAVRVAIEVDGAIHDEPGIKEYDHERTGWFEARDVLLIRFRNEEVLSHLDRVLQQLQALVQQRASQERPRTDRP